MIKRNTMQREVLRGVFKRAERPLTVKEILEEARVRHPKMGLATVYRNIRRMLNEEKIRMVSFSDQEPRYERVGMGHHHHFHCSSCGEIFTIYGCVEGIHNLAPSGFSVQTHEITLHGECSACG